MFILKTPNTRAEFTHATGGYVRDDGETKRWYPRELVDTTVAILGGCEEGMLELEGQEPDWDMLRLLDEPDNEKLRDYLCDTGRVRAYEGRKV